MKEGTMSGESLSIEHVYRETCSNLRATDDISFKLMGIVPLLSGATFLTFFLKGEVVANAGSAVVTLSLFAALVRLGLFRWELRDIQTCIWLIERAKCLERIAVSGAPVPEKPGAPQGNRQGNRGEVDLFGDDRCLAVRSFYG